MLGQLRGEFVKTQKERVFDELKVFLAGGKAEVGYAEVGEQLEMSEGAVKVAVHPLRLTSSMS